MCKVCTRSLNSAKERWILGLLCIVASEVLIREQPATRPDEACRWVLLCQGGCYSGKVIVHGGSQTVRKYSCPGFSLSHSVWFRLGGCFWCRRFPLRRTSDAWESWTELSIAFYSIQCGRLCNMLWGIRTCEKRKKIWGALELLNLSTC